MNVANTPGEDVNNFATNFQANTVSLPDFAVISSSLVVNGGTSTSSVNPALILGITIPLVVLRIYLLI